MGHQADNTGGLQNKFLVNTNVGEKCLETTSEPSYGVRIWHLHCTSEINSIHERFFQERLEVPGEGKGIE